MLLVYLLYNFPHGGNMYKHFEEIFVTPSWQKKTSSFVLLSTFRNFSFAVFTWHTEKHK